MTSLKFGNLCDFWCTQDWHGEFERKEPALHREPGPGVCSAECQQRKGIIWPVVKNSRKSEIRALRAPSGSVMGLRQLRG